MLWDGDKVQVIWRALRTDVEYEWSLKKADGKPGKSAIKLAKIMNLDAESISHMLGSDIESAIELRTTLSALLRSAETKHKAEIIGWIISDWGGIKRGREVIPQWADSLGGFSRSEIEGFTASMGTGRISSWSKILAFVDHERHAIYDSRTSIAINIAMMQNNISPKFYMSPAQKSTKHPDIGLAKSMIESRFHTLQFGYIEYLDFLNSVVDLGLAPSMVMAERAIFAGARETAKEMLAKASELHIGKD
jgi:hypothetical protein